MQRAGRLLGDAGVLRVYCVHGTFAGNDALGLLTELARFAPGLSESLRRVGKGAVDAVINDLGNFTGGYCELLREGLSAGAGRPIDVRRFNWSSQNNHIGRADGAVRLIDELATLAVGLPTAQLEAESRPRVMLWGHSHGGNLLALLTNLLGADEPAREEFLTASRAFYRRWCFPGVDFEVWPRVYEILGAPEHPLRRLKLDIVTIGTPVRYGWDTGGYDGLLHFINHRPLADGPCYLAPYPPSPRRVLDGAADGDYVQQIGIAGTNLLPNPLAIRTLAADWRLHDLLQGDLPREFVPARLRRGMRVPDEGTTLLVDYDDPKKSVLGNLAGHGVYTRTWWMPFHAEQSAEFFYAG